MRPVGEGRAPFPKRGDPNSREVRVSLAPEEWRRLRAWAAEDATTTEHVIERVLRAALDARPASAY